MPSQSSQTSSKPSKSAKKQGGNDIRMFFSNASAKPKEVKASASAAVKGTRRISAIEIMSDEDDFKKSKPSSSRTVNNDALNKSAIKPRRKVEMSSDDDAEFSKPAASKSKSTSIPSKTQIIQDSDSEVNVKPVKPVKTTNASNPLKRKKPHTVVSSDDDDESEQDATESPPVKKKRQGATAASTSKAKPRTSTTSFTAAPKANANKKKGKSRKDEEEDYEMSELSNEDEEDGGKANEKEDTDDDDADLVPTKKTTEKKQYKPKPKEKDKAIASPAKEESAAPATANASSAAPAKKNWAAIAAARKAGPVAPGSKAVPEPLSEDCLAGLTFVFTGELSSFSRDEAVDLAKRYGGRVTGAPSGKTSFVVVGDNAGDKKLETIKKLGIKTLDEDGFLNLIGTRKVGNAGGAEGEKFRKKKEKEEAEIKKVAKEMEKREKDDAKATGAKMADMTNQLWTTKYAPKSIKEICGNKSNVEKLLLWLQDWQKSYHAQFKKPGKHAMNVFRAILISGPPGIGKTTSAHLCAKMAGYIPIEMNASDTRSKKLVESGMEVGNRSLDGWMGGSGAGGNSVSLSDRCCLIMDEVDGMSAGDRGGVGALNAIIKKTKIPIICIANDRNAQKLKPLMHTTFNMRFIKPEATSVRSRILSILFKEKMKIPANVVDQLITGSQSDIRQVLNMLSTWRLSNESMSFDEGKSLVKMNEKYTIMTPFDVTNKVLGPYLFSATSRETLGDKMELYFHDHSFVPLFIQENYLKTQPARLRNTEGPEKELKQLQLMDKAASSVSDGDLVDALIHGPEQHWGLMPLHAVCSTVRPASFIYGPGIGFAGPTGMAFPQWLGQNSKQNKLGRQLTDVQARMRVKVSGDKTEIRRSYIPALFPRIIKPLIDDGASAIDAVISSMDSYFLSKEDWETIVELGVGDKKDEDVLKKIASAVKASFTRKYNAGEHPIAFHKGQEGMFGGGKGAKKIGMDGPRPDIEDAFELDDVAVDDLSDEEGTRNKKKGADDEVGGDKLLKAKKPGAAARGKAKAKSDKGKGK